MDEGEFIRITADDVTEANSLSLQCPVCADAVEKNVDGEAVRPVYCAKCQTMYHLACWQQNGGKCAILGCGHTEYKRYGAETGPYLTITHADIPAEAPRPAPSLNGSKELKRQEQEAARRQRATFWSNLFESLLRAIKIWR